MTITTRLLSGFIACLITIIAVAPQVLGAEGEKSHILYLKPGGSQVMEIDNISKDIKILISNHNIVHARMLKEDRVYIRGKKLGYCTVTVWDNISKSATAEIDVTVSYDLAGLKKQIKLHFPNQDINVYGADDGIVLSGTVSGPEVVEQVLRLTERFLPTSVATSMVSGGEGGVGIAKSGKDGDDDDDSSQVSGTGMTKTKTSRITNLLKVANVQQVMLEVKIAEVIRDNSMAWSSGFSYFGLGDDFGGFVGSQRSGSGSGGRPGVPYVDWGSESGGVVTYPDATGTDAGAIITDFVGGFANILLKIDNVALALEFLEGEGLAKTLAEPRLVALSGQEASFLAGGKFPYISGTTITEGGVATSTVEFEEFGVGLKFTPIVQSNGLITLRVAPTISDINEDSLIPSPNGLLPLVETRQLETTAQLYDGQTLVLAGLLREDMRDAVEKVPLLGDVPVLGSLFKSNAFQNEQSDLMISITPHLAKPVKEGLISYPGEFIKPPNRFEFYLMGKLEGARSPEDPSNLSDHNFNLTSQGGLEGSFGHSSK